MTMTDPLADMLTRIRNGQKSKLISVDCPHSLIKEDVVKVLVEEGYISGYKVRAEGAKKVLEIKLKYLSTGKSVINEIHRVSKPGKRITKSISDLQPYYNGLGIHILTTSKGIISDRTGVKLGVGGEIICKVFWVNWMSRVGKLPVSIPQGVSVKVDGLNVHVKGPKGELHRSFKGNILIAEENNSVTVTPCDENKQTRSMWGTARNIIRNMVHGVQTGFKVELEINGVGYRAAVKGEYLNLALGKSHNTKIQIPSLIKAEAPKQTILLLESIDKELLGQFTAVVIKQRPPEPYKGKGIKRKGQYVQRKEGKKK